MTEPKPTYALPIAGHRLGPYLSELTCKVCHAVLATVTEFDGRTALILSARGHPCLAFRARLHCECGEEKVFKSDSMHRVRLGIAEE